MISHFALLWPILFSLILNFAWSSALQRKPNIIIFLADDLGINDVSFRGSDQFGTYNIDALAFNGVILNNFYTSSLCTPSRAALLTSRFPIHTGMHHGVILEPEPWGLPLNLKLLPEYLKEVGYHTVLCGKWHLGLFEKEYTPTYRGFHRHHGYWQGYQDYYSHIVRETFGVMRGYDMRDGMAVDWNAKGKYSTDYFTDKAIEVINSNENDTPLFLLMSHLAAHSGNPDGGLKAPADVMEKFNYIQHTDRRRLAAVVSKLDESIGSVMEALHNKGMLDNSIVLFLSDNGAPTVGVHRNTGSNYPLRGIKGTELEGGVRNNAAIWSPLFKSQQTISNHLMSLVDIMPTLCSAAGIDVGKLGLIDGIDMWKSLSEGSFDSLRTEMPHNIDRKPDSFDMTYGAVRVEQWKYVKGSAYFGMYDTWMGDFRQSKRSGANRPVYDPEMVLTSKVNVIINEFYKSKQGEIENESGNFKNDLLEEGNDETAWSSLTIEKIQQMRNELTIKCAELKELEECKPTISPCLINIELDPCEKYNFAKKFPATMRIMEEKFNEYRSQVVAPLNKDSDYRANPIFYNNTWTNWYDYVDNDGFVNGNE